MDATAREEVIAQSLRGWVPLAEVANAVRQHEDERGEEAVRRDSLELIRDLATSGELRVGTVSREHGFTAVDGPVEEFLADVEAKWASSGDPEWWFVCWLENPAAEPAPG